MSEQRVQVVSVAPELRIDASVPLRIRLHRFEARGLFGTGPLDIATSPSFAASSTKCNEAWKVDINFKLCVPLDFARSVHTVIATDDDSLPRRRKRQPGKPNKDAKARQKRQ
jgi:hypothetical protein